MEAFFHFVKDCGSSRTIALNDANDTLKATEVWASAGTDACLARSLEISRTQREEWLANTSSDNGTALLVRVVRIPLLIGPGPHCLDISKDNLDYILSSFKLDALYEYGQSSPLIYAKFADDGDAATSSHRTALMVGDYFGLLSRYDSATHVTQAICWAGLKAQRLLWIFDKSLLHQKALAVHPYFLTLATVTTLNCSIDRRLGTVREALSQIENRTGHCGWDLMRFGVAQGDYGSLSAVMSGFAAALAAHKRDMRVMEEMLASYDEYAALPAVSSSSHDAAKTKAIVNQTRVLKQRLATQQIHIDYLISRVQTQLTALFNLTNQTDTRLSIALAKDSRTLASASKRDSSSMKTLAAVTVSFLPGTFVASLFSIPMFDWTAKASSHVLTAKFWIYWVVTIPLTMLTVGVWMVWTHRQTVLHRAQDRTARDEVSDDLNGKGIPQRPVGLGRNS